MGAGQWTAELAQSLMTADEHSERAIFQRLADSPEIAYRIIAGMYDTVVAQEERAAGIKRIGPDWRAALRGRLAMLGSGWPVTPEGPAGR